MLTLWWDVMVPFLGPVLFHVLFRVSLMRTESHRRQILEPDCLVLDPVSATYQLCDVRNLIFLYFNFFIYKMRITIISIS